MSCTVAPCLLTSVMEAEQGAIIVNVAFINLVSLVLTVAVADLASVARLLHHAAVPVLFHVAHEIVDSGECEGVDGALWVDCMGRSAIKEASRRQQTVGHELATRAPPLSTWYHTTLRLVSMIVGEWEVLGPTKLPLPRVPNSS